MMHLSPVQLFSKIKREDVNLDYKIKQAASFDVLEQEEL